MNLGVVLFSNYIGGTEKRICNLYNYLLTHSDLGIKIFINRYLVDLLREIDYLGDLESVLHIVPENRNSLTRFVDSPTDIFQKLNFRFPGPNWAIQTIKNQLRPKFLTVSNGGHDLDLAHYASPYGWNVMADDLPVLQEAQDVRLGILRSKISRDRILHPKNITICASNQIKAKIAKAVPSVDSTKLIVAPCSFIDYSKTRVARKEKIVTFSGRLIPYKNADLFLEAAEIVLKKRGDIKFRLMGRGRLETKLNTIIAEKKMDRHIEIGFVRDPIPTLARSLIFVSIQEIDNYHSQALMEAMACGCAIIASDVGSTSLLVDDAVGCRIPIDAKILADRIMEMVDNFESTEAKGIKARAIVMESQTIARYAEFMMSLFDQAYNYSAGRSKSIAK